MKKILSFSILIALFFSMFAQTATLTFTGRDANNNWVQLDRVVITDLTRNWSETIIWPDTVLTIQNGTGIDTYADNGGLSLSQNTPNPFNGTTDVFLAVADAGTVTLEITDMNGRVVVPATDISAIVRANNHSPQHQFRVTLASAGTYVMTVRHNGKTASIKMVNNGGGNRNGIEYAGFVETTHALSLQTKTHIRGTVTHPFDFGDLMEYAAYAVINGGEDTVIVSQALSDSPEIVVPFETEQTDGLPCPGTPTLTDIDGNVYNTVMLGNQCWMKENLRTTRFANGGGIPAMDTVLVTPLRYAPNGDEGNVATYGYLYNWPAVMNGAEGSNANPSGVQGVCPDGWHVPSSAEWTQLEEYVGSREEYVCGINNNNLIGKAMAAATGWAADTTNNSCAVGNDPSSNNATGFSILPAGEFSQRTVPRDLTYAGFSTYALLWSSTESTATSFAIWLILRNSSAGITPFNWGTLDKYIGGSVRCVRD